MENVWDYPRPPAVEPLPAPRPDRAGRPDPRPSDHALRVLETSHPPTLYLPADDVRLELLVASRVRSTWCEFKDAASYLDALIGDRRYEAVAWTYPNPSAGYETLEQHFAFYPGRVDAAWLDDERVLAQHGDFYGGWITAELAGPFKDGPSTSQW